MAQHIVDATGVWSDVGAVLEPDTTYRVRVVTTVEARRRGRPLGEPPVEEEVTELAYFRTEGPPGLTTLSTPVNDPEGEEFASGLETLDRYVRQTVPPTVRRRASCRRCRGPSYRAYDVGALFNEDYVDLMYRLARRDLAVYLYDVNNRPVRDAEGRLIVLANRWGEVEYDDVHRERAPLPAPPRRRRLRGRRSRRRPARHDAVRREAGPRVASATRCTRRGSRRCCCTRTSPRARPWIAVDSGASEGPRPGRPAGTRPSPAARRAPRATSSRSTARPTSPASSPVSTSSCSRGHRAAVGGVPRARGRRRGQDARGRRRAVLSGGSSPWKLPPWGAALQASNIWGGGTDGRDPVKPGTILVGGSPCVDRLPLLGQRPLERRRRHRGRLPLPGRREPLPLLDGSAAALPAARPARWRCAHRASPRTTWPTCATRTT